jgi:hypothetical protein
VIGEEPTVAPIIPTGARRRQAGPAADMRAKRNGTTRSARSNGSARGRRT